MTEPTKEQVETLLTMYGAEMGDGEVVSARIYLDVAGAELIRMVVNYGIAGTKVYEAPMSMITGEYDEVGAMRRLEDLSHEALKKMASDLIADPTGSKIQLIVRLRKAIVERKKADDGADAAKAKKDADAETKADADAEENVEAEAETQAEAEAKNDAEEITEIDAEVDAEENVEAEAEAEAEAETEKVSAKE